MSDEDDHSDNDDAGELEMPSAQPTVDAASPRGVEAQQRKANRERAESEAFWKRVFADPVGRREMWRLLFGDGSTHAFNTDFAVSPAGVPDQFAAWYRRGEQDFGLRQYHKWLVFDRLGVIAMHDEHDPRFAKPKPPGRKRRE